MRKRVQRIGFIVASLGMVLILIGIIDQAHLHRLVTVGITVNSVGIGFVIVPFYLFVSRRFLPTYKRLEQLCAAREMSCRLNTQKIRWVLWLSVIAFFCSTSSNLIELLVRHRTDTFTGVSLACELTFFCTLAFVAWFLQQTENEADLLLDELEGKKAAYMPGAPDSARFLLLLIPIRHRENLVGDLEEEFTTVVLPTYGLKKARAWYWWQVLASLGPLLWSEFKRAAGLALLWKAMR